MTYSTDFFIGVKSVQEVERVLRDYYEEDVWDVVEDVQPFDNGVLVTTKDLDRYDRDDMWAVFETAFGYQAVTEL
jgi:hypothetical protein